LTIHPKAHAPSPVHGLFHFNNQRKEKSMKPIQLPVAELKPALTGLGKIVAKRTTLPILNHIKIERTKDGWVALTATDLDQYVTVRLELPGDGNPATLLMPYDELLKITKTCPKTDTLLIRHGEGAVVIIEYAIGSEIAESKVDSLPAAEFPEIPRIKSDAVALPDALRESIHQALECASTDETRLILNGAYVDVSKSNAHYVVGTDGRHLFSSNSFSLPLKESLIIPNQKFLGWKEFNNDGEWQLKIGPKEKEDDPPPFQISSRRWRFIGRQIDGNYPNWRQVIPDSAAKETTLEFDASALDQVTQIIQRMPCDDPVNLAVGLEYSGKKLRILGRSPNAENWTKVEIPEAKATGKDVTIFVNRHLLTKALQFGLTTAEIIDGMSPMRFINEGRQMIIMPTRPTVAKAEVTPPDPEPEAKGDESENSAPDQPAAPAAASNERKPMPEQNGNTNGAQRSTTPAAPAEKSALETALAQIEIVRTDFRNAIAGLNKLGDQLKSAAREQKASEREVQSVRQTLRSLQSVRI
jgi:DNA polymerase III sliding clamp (beta) subunit (PCNA family)